VAARPRPRVIERLVLLRLQKAMWSGRDTRRRAVAGAAVAHAPELTPVPPKDEPHPYWLCLVGDRVIQERTELASLRVRDDRRESCGPGGPRWRNGFFTLLLSHLVHRDVGRHRPTLIGPSQSKTSMGWRIKESEGSGEVNGLLAARDLNGVLLSAHAGTFGRPGRLPGLTRED